MSVHARPGAKKDAVVGEYNGRLKLSLNAPPVDGRANAAAVAFLAKRLGVAKSCVELISGDTGRAKRFVVHGVTLEAAAAALSVEG